MSHPFTESLVQPQCVATEFTFWMLPDGLGEEMRQNAITPHKDNYEDYQKEV